MWYHITEDYHGKSVTFIPRVPPSGVFECRKTERICFAPTIKQCLMAQQGVDDWRTAYMHLTKVLKSQKYKPRQIHVYAIHGNMKVKHLTKKHVRDVNRTNEVWRLIPTTLKYIGIVKIVEGEPVIERIK